MKKLFQAVDVQTCHTLFKKGMASLIILSMLMADVVNAMEEEHDPLSIQRALSPSPREVTNVSESLHRRDGTDYETSPTVEENHFSIQRSRSLGSSPMEGSLQDRSPLFIPPSQSVVKSSHNSSKSTASVPDFILSSANPNLSEESDPEIDSPEDADAFLKDPFLSPNYSDSTSESYPDFNPSAAGPFKLKNLGSQGTLPQLPGNSRGGSLEIRSSPFTPRSKSVAETSLENGKPPVFVPGLTLSPANSHLLGGSDSEIDSVEETDILLEESQHNISRSFSIQSIDGKKRLSSAPAVVSSSSVHRLLTEASKLLESSDSKRYLSIQDKDGRGAPPPSVESLEDPESQGLLAIDDDSKCCSCCPTNRPLLPHPTDYTLPDASIKIPKRSKLLKTLTSAPSDQDNVSHGSSNESLSLGGSDSSSPHESPPKAVRGEGISLLSDNDSEEEEIDLTSHLITSPRVGEVALKGGVKARMTLKLEMTIHLLLPRVIRG